MLDEIQNVPALFSHLQPHLDAAEHEGVSSVLTRSHRFKLVERITQSLASFRYRWPNRGPTESSTASTSMK